jgi:hypothetical protein
MSEKDFHALTLTSGARAVRQNRPDRPTWDLFIGDMKVGLLQLEGEQWFVMCPGFGTGTLKQYLAWELKEAKRIRLTTDMVCTIVDRITPEEEEEP